MIDLFLEAEKILYLVYEIKIKKKNLDNNNSQIIDANFTYKRMKNEEIKQLPSYGNIEINKDGITMPVTKNIDIAIAFLIVALGIAALMFICFIGKYILNRNKNLIIVKTVL